MDRAYYRGIPAVTKAFEAILSLIAFILIMVAPSCVKTSITAGYFKFVTITAFILVCIVWLLFLCKLQRRIFRCTCINWPFLMFAFYGIICVFYFFGDLILAVQACNGVEKASVAFGFLALFAFLFDFGFSVRDYIMARRGLNKAIRETTNVAEGKY
ncbi:DgyrCDS14283 [Dimorphilus gyrociliatus]|nr:DgyrCDS14283 [Dimorphilus gyrociliatus]